VKLRAAAVFGLLAIGPGLPGWEPLPFEGRTENRFDGGRDGVLAVESRGGASMLFRRLEAAPEGPFTLSWRWRVERTMGPTDLTQKGADDRPAALYVSYPYDPATATVSERLSRPFVELAKGGDAPGRVLAYTWGGSEPRGAVLRSPYMGAAGAIVVLRSGEGPLGVWLEERVRPDLDYLRAFGAPPVGPPLQLAVGADSDDTASWSLAYIADIRLAPAEGG
jgi:hypothetical protein